MKRAVALFVLAAAAMLLLPVRARALDIAAGGAILMEATTRRVVMEKDADKRMPMASTTKIMTALVAVESGDLDRMVSVPDSAVGTEGSSMYLKRGEKLTLRDLLYGLMLTSGNDAAVTIACAVSGSVSAFAARMNQRAKQLGCENTNFVNPNGLQNADHYTTARDLAVIACCAMQNETFRQIVATDYHVAESGFSPRTLKNKNRLLWEYEGGTGIKTGYTVTAGKCLVFSACRDGLQLVGVVLDCPTMWASAKAILDQGFAALTMKRPFDAQLAFGMVEVRGGNKNSLAVVAKQGILYPVAKDGSDDVKVSVSFTAEVLDAPVACGAAVGTLSVFVNGQSVFSTPLITAESADKLHYPYYLREWFLQYLY